MILNLLSKKLCCPVVQTISTASNHKDLEAVVKAAVSLKGQSQKAPYVQADIDLTSKEEV